MTLARPATVNPALSGPVRHAKPGDRYGADRFAFLIPTALRRRSRGEAVAVIDTGYHLFVGGECYYRQIDSLAMSLCVAKALTDEQWEEYVLGGYNLTRKHGTFPQVSMAAFTDAFPSAYQRSRLATHLKKHGIPPLVRVAVLTDSALIRGAMTAFGWIMPSSTMRAFEVLDIGGCLKWLHQGATFDQLQAANAWGEARRMLGLDT